MRTAIGAVAVITLIALAVNLLGGDEEPAERTPQVAFAGTARAESEASRPDQPVVDTEAGEIRKILDDWYQNAFVDPSKYGDGTFSDVAKYFTKEAQTSFTEDLKSLTIGEAREEVRRVEPAVQTANVTVFFDKAGKPQFATAVVRFEARASLKSKEALPVHIRQNATYHFEKKSGEWLVAYYEADQKQNSVQPSPSPERS